MENSIAEAILTPWWKIPIYIVVTILTIRFTAKFDINAWLKARSEAKKRKTRQKNAEACLHVWTLFSSNPYSRCDKCLVLISTSILLTARAYGDPKPIITGEAPAMFMNHAAGELVTHDYIGGKG